MLGGSRGEEVQNCPTTSLVFQERWGELDDVRDEGLAHHLRVVHAVEGCEEHQLRVGIFTHCLDVLAQMLQNLLTVLMSADTVFMAYLGITADNQLANNGRSILGVDNLGQAFERADVRTASRVHLRIQKLVHLLVGRLGVEEAVRAGDVLGHETMED